MGGKPIGHTTTSEYWFKNLSINDLGHSNAVIMKPGCSTFYAGKYLVDGCIPKSHGCTMELVQTRTDKEATHGLLTP